MYSTIIWCHWLIWSLSTHPTIIYWYLVLVIWLHFVAFLFKLDQVITLHALQMNDQLNQTNFSFHSHNACQQQSYRGNFYKVNISYDNLYLLVAHMQFSIIYESQIKGK